MSSDPLDNPVVITTSYVSLGPEERVLGCLQEERLFSRAGALQRTGDKTSSSPEGAGQGPSSANSSQNSSEVDWPESLEMSCRGATVQGFWGIQSGALTCWR